MFAVMAFKPHHFAPAVVQRIERAPPKRQIQVRFLSVGPLKGSNGLQQGPFLLLNQ